MAEVIRQREPGELGENRRWLEDQLRDRSILPPQRSSIRIVKAGTISDADFPYPPPDYTEGIDTANSRRYFKVAGAWHYMSYT